MTLFFKIWEYRRSCFFSYKYFFSFTYLIPWLFLLVRHFICSIFLAQEISIIKSNNLPISQNSLLLWNVSFKSAHKKSLCYRPYFKILFATFRFSMRSFKIFSLKILFEVKAKVKFSLIDAGIFVLLCSISLFQAILSS